MTRRFAVAAGLRACLAFPAQGQPNPPPPAGDETRSAPAGAAPNDMAGKDMSGGGLYGVT